MDFNLRRFSHSQHWIGVEVSLDGSAILDGDFAIERSGEPKDHAALNLLSDRVGIGDVIAVDDRHDAVDLQLTGWTDADFGHLTGHRAVGLDDRHAASTSRGHRLTPVSLLGHCVEHAQVVWTIKHRASEAIGVLAGRMGHLIDEALNEEGILRSADAAPEHHRHMGVFQLNRHVIVGDLVGVRGDPLDRHRLHPIRNRAWAAQRTQKRTHRNPALQPRGSAVLVERSLEPNRGLRAVSIAPDILLTMPDQLYRSLDDLGDSYGVDQLIMLCAPTKSTADKTVVNI